MSVSKYWREMPHRYRLEAGKCKKCGKIYFPKRHICNQCRGQDFENIKLSREGKLETFTIIHVGPSQFAEQVPYAVGIVRLKENICILAQIADCDIHSLKTGMSLKIEFRRVSEDGEAGIIHYGYKCVPSEKA
ncbi:MAG: transcriptional regulator [Caldithrix sp. RBG_13_44_9]|nr:MAG: transcriptional regulator [Caldithrix sp. RBG_13_44_9]